MSNSTNRPSFPTPGNERSVKRGVSGTGLTGPAASTKKYAILGFTSHSQKPTPAIQQSLRVNIFPADVSRHNTKYELPNLEDKFVHTLQLVSAARILAGKLSSAHSSSHVQPSNVHNIECRKDEIDYLIKEMLKKFASSPFKDSEAIREIVLLGPVLEKEQYRWLVQTLLGEFNKNGILAVDALQAIVQLMQDAPQGASQGAPVDYLEPKDMVLILKSITTSPQLESQQLGQDAFYLTQAISRVVNVMADRKIDDLQYKELYEPLLALLNKYKKEKNDPFLQYQARYALQALQWVPCDDTPVRCFLRNLGNLAGGAIQMTEIRHGDISGITEGLPRIYKGGQGIFVQLKNILGSSKKDWFQEVRGAETLALNSKLAEMNLSISEAIVRVDDPWYGWGICQVLGEIAADPTWDEGTRGQAIVFLGEIHSMNLEVRSESRQNSKQLQEIRRWILTILEHLSSLPHLLPSASNNSIKIQAQNLSQGLTRKAGDDPFKYPYLLTNRLPLPRSSSLLNEVNKTVILELQLKRFRSERLQDYSKPAIYVPPMSKANLHVTDDQIESLETRVVNFLEDDHGKVMLILGDSGAGKSTFNLLFENKLWLDYRPGGPIPLFIDLKMVDVADKDMIGTHLHDTNLFSKDQIVEMRENHRQFILICDGYDECRSRPNLYTINKLNQRHQWEAKMIITCRSQYLPSYYRPYFAPMINGALSSGSINPVEDFHEAVIVPLSEMQIKTYIDGFVRLPKTRKLFEGQLVWSANQFMEQLRRVSPLMELVKNPFLLMIMLDVLPRMSSAHQDLSSLRMSRAMLYDQYVTQHFRREARRLIEQQSLSREHRSDIEMLDRDFPLLGMDFVKRLSVSIFKKHNGVNSVTYSPFRDSNSWKVEFFEGNKLLMESSPLVKNGHSFKFIHRSILEYLFTCTVFEPSVTLDESGLDDSSPTLGLSPYLDTILNPPDISSHPFGQMDLLSEPSIIHFLADRVQQSNAFKTQLLNIIELSKVKENASRAAANAISILIRAGAQFNGYNFRGIRIPGADLTEGHFDSAQLQGANLEGANMTRTWLRHADFSEAKMKDVRFGEKPSLNIGRLTTFVISVDSGTLAVGREDHSIDLYDTATMLKRRSLRGGTADIALLAFSSTRPLIASKGYWDNSIHIWDLNGTNGISVLEHPEPVDCLAFSPDGSQIASCSANTIRLWNVDTNEVTAVWGCSGHSAVGVAWSPDAKLLALACKSGVRLWEVSAGRLERALKCEGGNKFPYVSYSPDGHHIVASCHEGLFLWQLKSSEKVRLEGMSSAIGAVYSRDGRWIAAYDMEGSVIVRGNHTESYVRLRTGFTLGRNSTEVGFLNNQEVISIDKKGTIRIWDLLSEMTESERFNSTFLQRHTKGVLSVNYSHDGMHIISSSYDETIRQWDTATGSSNIVLQDHGIHSLAPLPGNHLVLKDGKKTLHERTSTPMMDHDASNNCQVVAYSGSRQLVASGDQNGVLQLLNNSSGSIKTILGERKARITYMTFSPDERQLALCSDDKTVRLWDTTHMKCTNVLEYEASGLSYSPCGKYLVISAGETLYIRDLESDIDRLMFSGTHKIACVAWSPCGHWIIAGYGPEKLCVWRIRTNGSNFSVGYVAAVLGFADEACDLAWSPTTPMEFVTGSRDHSVRVWRIIERNGQVRVELKWGSTNRLVARGARTLHALGLSKANKALLKQRYADDDDGGPGNDSAVDNEM